MERGMNKRVIRKQRVCVRERERERERENKRCGLLPATHLVCAISGVGLDV